MKVHPAPKKRNITLRYDIASTLSQSNSLTGRQKKLRRLPHIFAKVLELPFHSDADVLVQETPDSLRFVAATDDIGAADIRAHAVEICPGVTKIIVRGSNFLDPCLDELELDVWRFRLPVATRPELATAAYGDGELVVTVPKGINEDDDGGDGGLSVGLMEYVRTLRWFIEWKLKFAIRCYNCIFQLGSVKQMIDFLDSVKFYT
ncbi:hypothetical protein RJ639_021617 [Escallonia herrerae]|uniref:SHSP domain-containing protein n=1 Tax=Escallonia herrerae TaxID=1293975 RepID=A0AA89AGJ8_9ASTE|nr:hypothetical protein RJ639_021617 [Escallonia herrerae]